MSSPRSSTLYLSWLIHPLELLDEHLDEGDKIILAREYNREADLPIDEAELSADRGWQKVFDFAESFLGFKLSVIILTAR